jgi:ureidoacrylate peracid hydrolase
MEGTWGVDFFRLSPEPGDPVVTKHSYNGFHGTDLHAVLQQLGVRTLVLTGVATNVCVDSTLREGFFLGYHIVVVEDCVGSGNRAGHDGTLTTVRLNFGAVLGAEEVVTRLLGPSLVQ